MLFWHHDLTGARRRRSLALLACLARRRLRLYELALAARPCWPFLLPAVILTLSAIFGNKQRRVEQLKR